jgi:GNAT superfamily N-acetyltransferase
MLSSMEPVIGRATPADHDRLYRLYREANALDNPKAPVASRRSFDALETKPFPGERNERYVAKVGGEVVGMVTLEMPVLENTDRVFVFLVVHPDHRRRGVGTALHDYVVRYAKEQGRTMLGGQTLVSIEGCPVAEPGSAFVRQLGYQPALPEVARQLEVKAVDSAEHDRLLADAWTKADGYRVVRWSGVAPDELIDDVAYLDSRLITDAPMGELDLEPQNITAERVRDFEKALEIRGRKTVHTGAVHEATGRLAAWTTICLDPELNNGQAFQFITLVDPDHRGHRLGTIVKIENLRYALTVDPGLSRLTTWNAAANGYMIQINEALGYRPAYGQMEWQLPLPSE